MEPIKDISQFLQSREHTQLSPDRRKEVAMLVRETNQDEQAGGPMKDIVNGTLELLDSENYKRGSESQQSGIIAEKKIFISGNEYVLRISKTIQDHDEVDLRIAILSIDTSRKSLTAQSSPLPGAQFEPGELTYRKYTLINEGAEVVATSVSEAAADSPKGFAKSLLLLSHESLRHAKNIFPKTSRIQAKVAAASTNTAGEMTTWTEQITKRLGYSGNTLLSYTYSFE